MRLTPTDEQEADIERIVHEPTRGALVASDVGVGKSLVATEAALRLGANTVLIISPKNVMPNWRRHFALQAPQCTFKVISSTKDGLAAYDALRRGVPGVYHVGREFMVRSQGSRWSWSEVDPDVVILDESHAIQNRNSQLFKVIKKLPARGFRIAMSATPAGNRFDGIWSTCRWLWPHVEGDSPSGLLVDTSKHRWIAQWCEITYDPWTFDHRKPTGEKVPGAWVAQLPCYIRREAKIGKLEHEIVYTDLTPRQRKLFDSLATDALAWLDENNALVADLPITQRLRMRQVALGEVTFNEAGEVDFAPNAKSAKVDTLVELLDDEPTLIVVAGAQKFIKVILARLGNEAVEWSGKVTHAAREQIMKDFGGKYKYLVATIESVAEGLDGLQNVCHKMIWLSESLNGVLNEQVEGRLNRTGQKFPVQSIKILATDTDDDRYFESLVEQRRGRKESFG